METMGTIFFLVGYLTIISFCIFKKDELKEGGCVVIGALSLILGIILLCCSYNLKPTMYVTPSGNFISSDTLMLIKK